MPRYRSSRTGSVIVVDAETATRMGPEWGAITESSKPSGEKPAKRAPAVKAAARRRQQ